MFTFACLVFMYCHWTRTRSRTPGDGYGIYYAVVVRLYVQTRNSHKCAYHANNLWSKREFVKKKKKTKQNTWKTNGEFQPRRTLVPEPAPGAPIHVRRRQAARNFSYSKFPGRPPKRIPSGASGTRMCRHSGAVVSRTPVVAPTAPSLGGEGPVERPLSATAWERGVRRVRVIFVPRVGRRRPRISGRTAVRVTSRVHFACERAPAQHPCVPVRGARNTVFSAKVPAFARACARAVCVSVRVLLCVVTK